ncbi:MAG: glycosyltransferase family 2 protein [Limisphaerales bacterium]
MPERLSIAIPTRNRLPYLRDLLTAFEAQIRETGVTPDDVRLYISDNAATDGTPQFCEALAARLPHVQYSRNPQNIGAAPNVRRCARLAQGRHTWMLGDDELLEPGALKNVLAALDAEPDLGLLLLFDTRYDSRLPQPSRYATYRDYAATCARLNAHALIETTLVSSNVYRSDLFDHALAEASDGTDFPHSYAWTAGLMRTPAPVLVAGFPAITVRPRRAASVDGEWPQHLEKSWLELLRWQRETMQLPELGPEAAVAEVRRRWMARLKKNPWAYVRDNAGFLKDPQAWKFFLKRFGFHSRTK